MKNKKIKIGVLVGQLVQVGGVGIVAIEEVKNLNKLGFEAELIVLMENKKFLHNDFTDGVAVRWLSREYSSLFKLNFKIPLFSFFSLFHLLSPYAASMKIKAGQYDCIICHETYNCFAALRLSKKNKIPYIMYMWDPISYILPRVYSDKALRFLFPVLKPLAAYFDKKFVLNSKKTVISSGAHAGLLSRITGADKKVEVVPPGIYPAERIPDRRGDYILALTKWDLGKNPIFLLDVLRILKHKKNKMVIAGNWVQKSLFDEFKKKAVEFGLWSRIEIIGRFDDKRKEELFSGARVLVHPIFEGFGMMCLEAAGFGCPFIIPKGSGVTELFQDNSSGFFPKEGDVFAFAGLVDMLLDDERLAWETGRKAWEAARRYSWENHARKLLGIIQSSEYA